MAIGSKVPPCPILSPRCFNWNTERSLATTSEDVHPVGLSTFRKPEVECVLPRIVNFRVQRWSLTVIGEAGNVVDHALTLLKRGVENERYLWRASHLGSNAQLVTNESDAL